MHNPVYRVLVTAAIEGVPEHVKLRRMRSG